MFTLAWILHIHHHHYVSDHVIGPDRSISLSIIVITFVINFLLIFAVGAKLSPSKFRKAVSLQTFSYPMTIVFSETKK